MEQAADDARVPERSGRQIQSVPLGHPPEIEGDVRARESHGVLLRVELHRIPPDQVPCVGFFQLGDLGVLMEPEGLHERCNGGVEGTPRQPVDLRACLLYTSPSPRDATLSRMPSSA